MPPAGSEQPPAIPVTIVAGFLGAGKTTLLNHILSAEHDRRIGVLVNDFGAINIDAELVTQVEDGMITLANGCICCSIRMDLIGAVLELADLENRPDHIVIESSGVADPSGIVNTFLGTEIWDRALLDGLITVVDAEQVLTLPAEESRLARAQVAGGDLIVLNKTDTVDDATLARVRNWIREVQPGVEILEAVQCRAPIEVLIGIDHLREPSAHAQAPREHDHGVDFETWSYESDKPLRLARLQQLLNRLPSTLFRAKGFIYATEKPRSRLLLQMVGRRAVLSADRPWEADRPRNRLVFIARRGTCDFDGLGRALDDCRSEAPA